VGPFAESQATKARKVIIVEGKTDRDRLLEILNEEVEIVCTNGTLSYERLEELIAAYQGDEIYVFVDADESGNKLRRLIKNEFPEVIHLYTQKIYREVATTPIEYLAQILERAHFEVKPDVVEEAKYNSMLTNKEKAIKERNNWREKRNKNA